MQIHRVIFSKRKKKRNAGNWQNVSFKKFKLKGDNEQNNQVLVLSTL